MATVASRYSTVAILLHWTIALAVVAMIPMGLWMTAAIERPEDQSAAYRVFQLHKSVGFLILALTVVRIVWRLTHRPPRGTEPAGFWQHLVAGSVHMAFYVLLLAMPLTGWLFVSSGWNVSNDQPLAVPTSWFGLFDVPHIPGISDLAADSRRGLAFQAMGAHSLMAWGAVALIVMHAGAALKHHLVDRDAVLWRMLPIVQPGAGHPTASADPGSGPVEESGPKWPARLVGAAFVAILGLAGAIAAAPAPASIDPAPTTLSGVRPPSTIDAPVSPGTAIDPAPNALSGVSAPSTTDAPASRGTATAWTLDTAASSIVFSGTHAGRPFEGRFDDWDGQIWFDPDNLAGSRAVITVRTASAQTGDSTQEGALRGAEWLDPSAFPTARFEALTFRALGGDRYEATGTLRIKQTTLPLVLPFTYRRDADGARVEGEVSLDRTALDLGMVSDAGAVWVSKTIGVRIRVTARPRP